jgi:hypothetical protein
LVLVYNLFLEDVYEVLNTYTTNISDINRLVFYLVLRIFEFNNEYLEKHREIIQKPIIENLKLENEDRIRMKEKNLFNNKKVHKEIKCNKEWPICMQVLEKDKRDILPFYVVQVQNFPKIFNEYVKADKNRLNSESIRKPKLRNKTEVLVEDILIERVVHICGEKVQENEISILSTKQTTFNEGKKNSIIIDNDCSFDMEDRKLPERFEEDFKYERGRQRGS